MLFSFRHDCGCELVFRQADNSIKFDQRFTCRQHKDKPLFQIPRSGADFVSYTLTCGCAYLRDTRVFTCPACREKSLSSLTAPKSDIAMQAMGLTKPGAEPTAGQEGTAVPDNHAYHAARKPSVMAVALCARCGQQTLPDGTCHCGATPVGRRTPVTQCVTFTDEEREILDSVLQIAHNNKMALRRNLVKIPAKQRSRTWAEQLATLDTAVDKLYAVWRKVKQL